MNVEVKSISCPDVDLSCYVPSDPAFFGIYLELFLGPVGESWSERFGVMVCTPKWFSEKVDREGVQAGFGYVFTSEWPLDGVMNYLQYCIRAASAPTWEGVARKLGRFAEWEFSD